MSRASMTALGVAEANLLSSREEAETVSEDKGRGRLKSARFRLRRLKLSGRVRMITTAGGRLFWSRIRVFTVKRRSRRCQ